MTTRYEIPEFARLRPRTRIVCTIGPATATADQIKTLIRAGMSVARLNLAHGTAEIQSGYLNAVRAAADELRVTVGVLADLPGPKYRTGRVGTPVRLEENARFTLTSQEVEGDGRIVSVVPAGFHRDIRKGARVLIDDGAVELAVDDVDGETVVCTVTGGGELKQRKGVVAPGHVSSLDYFTDETVAALEFVATHDIDFVGLSYVRTADDMQRVRRYLSERARTPQLVAKIELEQAVDNLAGILEASDAVMVARGDLGVELPLERVPHEQKKIILAANKAGKAVITATQMLESMIQAANPTRAEATDVYNAVLNGTDAVMLSGETSIGRYPSRAVHYMARFARQAESDMDFDNLQERRYAALLDARGQMAVDDAIAYSAVKTATRVGAKAILAFTESGSTAARVASFRPSVPVLAMTAQQQAGARLSLRWGLVATSAPATASVSDMFYEGSVAAQQTGYARNGDLIVVVVGMPIGVPGNTNLLRVIRVPEPRPQ